MQNREATVGCWRLELRWVRQLAALLGQETVQIRKMDGTFPRVSVIGSAVVIKRCRLNTVATVRDRYPDLIQNLSEVKSPDVRGRKSDVFLSAFQSAWVSTAFDDSY